LHYTSRRDLKRSLSDLRLKPKRSPSRARSIARYRKICLTPEKVSNIERKLILPYKVGVVFLLTIPLNKPSKPLSFGVPRSHLSLDHGELESIRVQTDKPSVNLTRDKEQVLQRHLRRDSAPKLMAPGQDSPFPASNALHQKAKEVHGLVNYTNNVAIIEKNNYRDSEWKCTANANFESTGRDSNEPTLDSEPMSPQVTNSHTNSFKRDCTQVVNLDSHIHHGRFDCRPSSINKDEGPLKFLEKFKQFARKTEPQFTNCLPDHFSTDNSVQPQSHNIGSLNGMFDFRQSLPDNFQLRPIPICSKLPNVCKTQADSKNERFNGPSDPSSNKPSTPKTRAGLDFIRESNHAREFAGPECHPENPFLNYQNLQGSVPTNDQHISPANCLTANNRPADFSQSGDIPPPPMGELPSNFSSFNDFEHVRIISEDNCQDPILQKEPSAPFKSNSLSLTNVMAQRHIDGLGDVSESNGDSMIDNDDSSMHFTISETDQIYPVDFSFKNS
jgi:hypothetical protein